MDAAVEWANRLPSHGYGMGLKCRKNQRDQMVSTNLIKSHAKRFRDSGRFLPIQSTWIGHVANAFARSSAERSRWRSASSARNSGSHRTSKARTAPRI